MTGWNFCKFVRYEVTITLDEDIYCSFRFSELYDLYRRLDRVKAFLNSERLVVPIKKLSKLADRLQRQEGMRFETGAT